MARARGKSEKSGENVEENETKLNLEDDLDSLFKLPLMEFTAARNTLAARLREIGRSDEAERVRSMPKPSISAWAVNQLYWKHRDAFDQLIAVGKRLALAQASQLAGKAADMSGPLATRREALSGLSRLAGALLRDAGHNPTLDTMRRITTTLEALSTYSSFPDAPAAGRLTHDLDPPGFQSLAALASSAGRAERTEPTRAVPSQPSTREEGRQARIASAKAALEAAERAFRETQSIAQDVSAELKKATAQADEMEKDRREAEARLEKARTAETEARQRVHTLTADAEKAASALQDAERALEKARKELKDITE
jgi:hypothetical protein